MVWGGNLLTNYQNRLCTADVHFSDGTLHVRVRSRDRQADIDLTAHVNRDADVPDRGIFSTWKEARRFAGPLPYTFDYEKETHSIVRIRGVRQNWNPRPVAVEVREITMLRAPMFQGATGVFAGAFHTSGIDYRWERGILEPLGTTVQ